VTILPETAISPAFSAHACLAPIAARDVHATLEGLRRKPTVNPKLVQTSPVWIARCEAQITATLDVLEEDRRGRRSRFWLGETIKHADIAVAVFCSS